MAGREGPQLRDFASSSFSSSLAMGEKRNVFFFPPFLPEINKGGGDGGKEGAGEKLN